MIVASYAIHLYVYPNCIPHQSVSLVFVALFYGTLVQRRAIRDYLHQEGDADMILS